MHFPAWFKLHHKKREQTSSESQYLMSVLKKPCIFDKYVIYKNESSFKMLYTFYLKRFLIEPLDLKDIKNTKFIKEKSIFLLCTSFLFIFKKRLFGITQA